MVLIYTEWYSNKETNRSKVKQKDPIQLLVLRCSVTKKGTVDGNSSDTGKYKESTVKEYVCNRQDR